MRIYRTKKKPKPSKNLHKVNSRKSRTTSFPTTIMTNGGFSEGWQGWLVILKIIGKNSSIFSVTNILCVKHFLIWFKFECLLKMYNVPLAILSLLWRSLDFMNPVGNKAKRRISKQMFQESKARNIFRKMNISYPLIHTSLMSPQKTSILLKRFVPSEDYLCHKAELPHL